MNAMTTPTPASRGAGNIADAIRAGLLQRGCRNEDIFLDWVPDPALVASVDAPELKAALVEGGRVRQMFSREELEVSCDRLGRESVLAKIDLVVESLHAGLP